MSVFKPIVLLIALCLYVMLGASRELGRRKRSDGLDYVRPGFMMGRAPSTTTPSSTTTERERETKDDMPAPGLPLLPWWARVLFWTLLWIIVLTLVCCLYTLFVMCCVPVNPAPGEVKEFKARKEREIGRPVDVYWNAKTRKMMWAEK